MHGTARLFVSMALFLGVAVVMPNSRVTAQVSAGVAFPKPRTLAPGILTVISAAGEDGETFSGPVPVVEITNGIPDLDWAPNYEPKSGTLLERAKGATFRRPIWSLEFAFKPLRMVEVDVPQASGKMQKKLIWYMVYRVKNVGYDLNPKPIDNASGKPSFAVEKVNFPETPQRFFPHFVLESHEFKKQYLDRILPAARKVIVDRERVGSELFNSVEMSRVRIPLSDDRTDRSVWGFVTWEDVDPRIDFFSISIRGLTNAFKFVDPPGAYKPGDPPGTGRKFTYKTLKLHFWRAGDTEHEDEIEISYGVPVESDPVRQNEVLAKYGLTQRLDYLWVYR